MGDGPNRIDDIFELIEALNGPIGSPEITSRFADYLAQFGFSSFLISGLPTPPQPPQPYVLINGWPEEWFERYRLKNHYRHDPVARRCFETHASFIWDELPPKLLEERAARLVMSEAADFGLAQGMSVPLHGLFGMQAIVTMAGRYAEVGPESRNLVHLAAIYAFNAASHAAQAERDMESIGILTTRERDVVRWIGEGKTFWEISQILGISEAAATAYMVRVRRKLNAKTSAQALVEAIRLREIAI